MSVIVSDLPEIHCLVCSRMRFVCFITVAHWLLIITQGSANKPGYLVSPVVPYLGVLSLHQLLLFIVPEWVTLHFAPLKFVFPQDNPVLSVWCSILFQLCVITSCVLDINALLKKTVPKPDSRLTLLLVSLHCDIPFVQENDHFHSLFTYLYFNAEYIFFSYLLECKLTFQNSQHREELFVNTWDNFEKAVTVLLSLLYAHSIYFYQLWPWFGHYMHSFMQI